MAVALLLGGIYSAGRMAVNQPLRTCHPFHRGSRNGDLGYRLVRGSFGLAEYNVTSAAFLIVELPVFDRPWSLYICTWRKPGDSPPNLPEDSRMPRLVVKSLIAPRKRMYA